MKPLAVAASLIAFGIAGCATPLPGASEGWSPLFDGRSLVGFDRVGDANWRIVDGAVVADQGTGFLVSKGDHVDFELRVEFYAEADTNSGVFLRCSDRQKLTAATCYEVNIWDRRPAPEYGTGAIVDHAKVSPTPRAGGQWNTFVITAKGDFITVTLNGVKTVNLRDGKHRSGPVALQYAPGVDQSKPQPIKFRRVQIRPL